MKNMKILSYYQFNKKIIHWSLILLQSLLLCIFTSKHLEIFFGPHPKAASLDDFDLMNNTIF